MAHMPTKWEEEHERKMKENDQRIRNLKEQQFIEKWKNALEGEKVKMIFNALYEKADKDHCHPHELI